jgi:hypothetical protein
VLSSFDFRPLQRQRAAYVTVEGMSQRRAAGTDGLPVPKQPVILIRRYSWRRIGLQILRAADVLKWLLEEAQAEKDAFLR